MNSTKSAARCPSSRVANKTSPIRTDDPAATIQRAFDESRGCPDWDMLTESAQAEAYQIGMTDSRIGKLIEWRDDIESAPSTSEQTVRDARHAVYAYIISRFQEKAVPNYKD
jgi:hypothetical protein